MAVVAPSTQEMYRDEQILFDSSKVQRSLCGSCHYNISNCCCSNYIKVTSKRVVYTTWNKVPCPCDIFGLCGPIVPVGKRMSQFDTVVIRDIDAKQDCFQMFTDEGDIVIYKVTGTDVSDGPNITIRDVPNIFPMFDELSYHLANLHLPHYEAGLRRGNHLFQG